jgi:hypothetical protein
VPATTLTFFSEAAIQDGFFFQLPNLQEHKEIPNPCLTQLNFCLFTPP